MFFPVVTIPNPVLVIVCQPDENIGRIKMSKTSMQKYSKHK